MSGSDEEGDVTPRHRPTEASSPERTPGRSPEGHVSQLLHEAEERSQRRAAAIRDVLQSIRIAPTPRLPGRPDVQEEAWAANTASDASLRSSQELVFEEHPRAAPQAVQGPDNAGPTENVEALQTRCGSLQEALDSCRLEVQEAQRAAAKSQEELASLEGRAAKREAELRQEIIELRSQQSKEREKWRSENKRLQSSLKETQRRAKAESEAKSAAVDQVEVLRQQLARSEGKRSRDEKEAKALEQMTQRHQEFLRWVALRCLEAFGEAQTEDFTEETCRELLSKLIQRAKRGSSLDQKAEAPPARMERDSGALQTEWRGRVRAAEHAQKNLQRLMQQEAEAFEMQREQHTEELVELRLRVNALQRAKEASERYVEEADRRRRRKKEDAWIRNKAEIRQAEAEVCSAVANVRHFEAEAACASEEAVTSRARRSAAEAMARSLQAELAELQDTSSRWVPPPVDLSQAQQRWRDAAVVEEVSEAQRQMGQWRSEAERSRAELAQLRAGCEKLQLQSAEQAKVEEAKRNFMQTALKEQAQEMQADFDQALREVQDLREKQGYELQEKARQLQDQEDLVGLLKADLERSQAKKAELEAELEEVREESSKQHERLASTEASARSWEEEAQQRHLRLNEEVLEMHQSYAKRINALRAQHGGEKRAFEAVEDELRQLYSQELLASQKNQERWAEATEAALAGEAAEASLARRALEESETWAMRQHTEVQQQLQIQLLLLKNHLKSNEAPPGLHPTSHELFMELCCSMQEALCDEVRRNPCNELRRSLCRDLKQELRDQLRSEVMSARRVASSREASTGSTTGSSARRPGRTPASEIRQELTRRGAALMDAFTAAADEVQHRQEPRSC